MEKVKYTGNQYIYTENPNKSGRQYYKEIWYIRSWWYPEWASPRLAKGWIRNESKYREYHAELKLHNIESVCHYEYRRTPIPYVGNGNRAGNNRGKGLLKEYRESKEYCRPKRKALVRYLMDWDSLPRGWYGNKSWKKKKQRKQWGSLA